MAHLPTIACIDDDAAVREALEGLLRALGYRVEVYASAEDFLASDRLGSIDCLITDVKLGGMSGLALLNQLAASSTPISTIIITAYADDQVRKLALEGGALCVLAKPITEEALMAAIGSALASGGNNASP